MNIPINASFHLPYGRYWCLFSGMLLTLLFLGYTSLNNMMLLEATAIAILWQIKDGLPVKPIPLHPKPKFRLPDLYHKPYIDPIVSYSSNALDIRGICNAMITKGNLNKMRKEYEKKE